MGAMMADVNPWVAAAQKAPVVRNGRDVAAWAAMKPAAPRRGGRAAALSSSLATTSNQSGGAAATRENPTPPKKRRVKADAAVDYKEAAAAALEQIFTESPDSDPQAQRRRRRRRRKLDLFMRIALRRKRLRQLKLANYDNINPGRKINGDECSDADHRTMDIWSPAVSRLLRQHGGSFNLVAQKWSSLDTRLLTVDEERWLASLMKPCKKLVALQERLAQQLGRLPSHDEWAHAANMDLPTLARHVAVHQAARNKLVKMNLRLVKHQTRKYHREASRSNLSFIDLCQEGVKGLMIAVERFDPSKGFRFSTYAIFWIRNSILRAQTRSGYPIRSPFNFAEIKMSVNKIKWELKSQGRDNEGDHTKMRKIMLERAGVDEERYKVVMRSNHRLISLHKRDRVTGTELIENLVDPLSNDGNANYLLGNGGSIIPSDPSIRLAIDDVLDSLKPKESFVLRQRFGLDGKGERALGEIGRNMRISREMVRKYEARGLLKLKHPTRLSYLRSFLSCDS